MLAQRFVYGYLKLLVKISLRLFYRSFTTQGNAQRNIRGPFIVVSNHPNTLMDGLIVSALLKQRIGYLGNASLFRNPKFAAVLRFLGMIPIYRKQDLLPGETMENNDDSFRQVYAYLEKGGGVLVFPEGTSLVGRRLLEIKTGTARMALGYESAHGFEGGLKVLPVSINYSSSTHFRTRVHVNLNEPIQVGAFRKLHEEDSKSAVRVLTDEISYNLSEGLVILDDPKQERMFQQAVRLLRKEWQGDKSQTRFEREKLLAGRLRSMREESPETYLHLQGQLEQWFALLDRLGLKQSFFEEAIRKTNPAILALITLLLMLLGAPFAMVGIVTGYLPYRLSGWLPPLIAKDIEYRAPIMMVLGVILFPLTYAGFSLAFWGFMREDLSPWWSLGVFFALPACGWVALEWMDGLDRLVALVRMIWMQGKSGSIASRLEEKRNGILRELKKVLS